MKKYVGLFVGIFMFSACCAAPVRQVDMHGGDYYVSIKSHPRHHHHRVIVPVPPRPIVHIAPRPPHSSHSPHSPHQPHWRG